MKIRPAELPTETLPPKTREVPTRKEVADVRVAFSKTARLLAESQPDDRVDLQRVDQIRKQIQDGTYKIDDTSLAEALVAKELQWTPPRS